MNLRVVTFIQTHLSAVYQQKWRGWSICFVVVWMTDYSFKVQCHSFPWNATVCRLPEWGLEAPCVFERRLMIVCSVWNVSLQECISGHFTSLFSLRCSLSCKQQQQSISHFPLWAWLDSSEKHCLILLSVSVSDGFPTSSLDLTLSYFKVHFGRKWSASQMASYSLYSAPLLPWALSKVVPCIGNKGAILEEDTVSLHPTNQPTSSVVMGIT